MAFSIFGKKNSESPLLDSPGENRYITKIEYVSLILSRIGGMFGTTLTGTLAATFLYELFFADFPEVGTEQIAGIAAVQTTIQYVLGIAMPLIAGVIVQKWKTKWGRYRQWYLLNLIPYFILTISFYWVPKGWTVQQMIWLRYGVAATQTVLNAFNVLSQNLIQVITPNSKEKKTVATLWQISYYLGYGLAYLSPEIFKLFIPKADPRYSERYVILTLFAASLTLIGNLMCGLFCKERIELPKKEKTKLSKSLFTLFKYKNYRAYQYFTWVNVFAGLGKWSTLLAGITVGSSNVILLTVPTAAGTVVGNVVCGVIARKHEPTKILKFCGVYSITAAAVLFGICYGEKVMGINFWEGGTAVFFYIFYFLFGVGVGFQELSMSHYTMEYNDYLEWQTGERLESVQGIIPGWINSGITYAKDLLIPYILVWVAYPTSDDRKMDLVDVIKNRIASGELSQEQYLTTCMWLLAFLLFGYALTNLLRALILKFFYNIEGEKKEQMYRELEEIRLKRHAENEQIAD
ncbi:MAG: MFS transporter [Clostridia bacterium]|nr:MFS transporter [Clostridia bacterium]MBR5423667.1 MFS transporter [Clostridia bacterium]